MPVPTKWTPAEDLALRQAAMDWLEVRSQGGTLSVPSEEIRAFHFRGERVPLMDKQRGIRKPAVLDSALSIMTAFRRPGKSRPYNDAPGADGMLRYKWRGDEYDHYENRALRSAQTAGVPLMWFFGVDDGIYLPVFPIYVLGEEVADQQFILDPNVGQGLVHAGSVVEEAMRRYIVSQTRRRLHQPVFRATVMRAYRGKCAVCSLAHERLLDAAHIVPDHAEGGIASVRNGLAMCKIHHAAYDANILGVDPEGVVHISEPLLSEVDGPMLTYGLQRHHGKSLMSLPSRKAERPDPLLLESRWVTFSAKAG